MVNDHIESMLISCIVLAATNYRQIELAVVSEETWRANVTRVVVT